MTENTNEYYQQRVAKLDRLKQAGVDPYPARFRRTHTAVKAVQFFQRLHGEEKGVHTTRKVTVAGRITAHRTMGKASFMDLRDGTGKIQLYLRSDDIGQELYDRLAELDLGDFIGATGPLFRTRTGEVTVEVQKYTLLSKALQSPPEKWHGLTDVEARYRHRYLDLMGSEEVRSTFIIRAKVVAAVRQFLNKRGFMEVETPVLQDQAGGAMARPFITHHNALDQDRFLRISLELHLKRLIVGGFEKVYEIGRIFRNEGISTKHNPEFTLLESYEAYADYNDVMQMVEEMFGFVAKEAVGTTQIPYGDHIINLDPPWPRVSLKDAIQKETGIDFLQHPTASALYQAVRDKGLRIVGGLTYGKLIDEIFSEYVEPKLVQPVFLIDYPIELSPLAKRKTDDPRLVERFEGFIGGLEIANAYSELNDPIDQRGRFEQQAGARAEGDDEAEIADEDFLFALEHGMPPTGGLGVGIDRLAMLFTNNTSIREVILFPQLRTRE